MLHFKDVICLSESTTRPTDTWKVWKTCDHFATVSNNTLFCYMKLTPDTVLIPKLTSIEDYNRFMFQYLPDHAESRHCLVAQWDIDNRNTSVWDESWVQYSYADKPSGGKLATCFDAGTFLEHSPTNLHSLKKKKVNKKIDSNEKILDEQHIELIGHWRELLDTLVLCVGTNEIIHLFEVGWRRLKYGTNIGYNILDASLNEGNEF